MKKLVYADEVIDLAKNYYPPNVIDAIHDLPDANTDVMVELAKIAQKIDGEWYVPVQKAMELLQL